MTTNNPKSEPAFGEGSTYAEQHTPQGGSGAGAQDSWANSQDEEHRVSDADRGIGDLDSTAEPLSARDDQADSGADFSAEDVDVEFKDLPHSHAPLPSDGGELGVLERQIGKLRTELLLRSGRPESASLTLAVLSTSSGDGRSLIAAELAKSFARLGRSTLLIDADLRRPTQHKIFGFNLGKGLVQAIVDDVPPALHGIHSFTSLSVLSAGSRQNYDPTELISHTRFKRIIDSLRGIFEFIVIDTPAFNGHPDAQVVAAVAGKVLTVHRAGTSQYSDARAMLRSLTVSHAAVIGSVLNHH